MAYTEKEKALAASIGYVLPATPTASASNSSTATAAQRQQASRDNSAAAQMQKDRQESARRQAQRLYEEAAKRDNAAWFQKARDDAVTAAKEQWRVDASRDNSAGWQKIRDDPEQYQKDALDHSYDFVQELISRYDEAVEAENKASQYVGTLYSSEGAEENLAAAQDHRKAIADELAIYGVSTNGTQVDASNFYDKFFALQTERAIEAAGAKPVDTVALLLGDEGAYAPSRTELLTDFSNDQKTTLAYLREQDEKNGTNLAEIYRQYIESAVIEGRALETATKLGEMDYGLGRTLAYGGAAAQSGFDAAMNELAKTLGINTFDQTQSQQTAGLLRADLEENGTALGQFGFDALQSVGAMVPGIVAGGINPAVGAAVFATTTGSSGYQQKLAEGWLPNDAAAYGILVAIAEGGLQYATGGISKLGGKFSVANLAKNIIDKIDPPVIKAAANALARSGSEFTEEFLQTYIEPAIVSAVQGTEYDTPELREAIRNGMLGAVTSLGLGAGEFVGDIRQGNADVAARQAERQAAVDAETARQNEIVRARNAQAPQATQNAIPVASGGITPAAPQNAEIAPQNELNTQATQTGTPTRVKVTPRPAPVTQPTGQDVLLEAAGLSPATSATAPAQSPVTTNVQPPVETGEIRERSFPQTLAEDAGTDTALRERLADDPEVYRVATNKSTLQKAQDIYDQGLDVARSTLDKAVQSAQDGRTKLPLEMIPLAQKVANDLSAQGNVDEAQRIIADIAAELTQAGQFIQAASILLNRTPASVLATIQKAIDKVNKAAKTNRWKAELTQSEIDMINSTDFTQEGAFESVYETVFARIGKEMPSTLWEKLTEIRRINMLLRPRTMIKNVAGNVPMAGLRKVSEKLSGAIQDQLVKSGKLNAEAQTRTGRRISKESRDVASKVYEEAKDVINGNSNRWDANSIIRKHRTIFKPNNAIAKIMGKQSETDNMAFLESTRRLTYELLERGDAPFVKSSFTDSLASYCEAHGIKDADSVPQEAIDSAIADAMEATFKTETILGNALNQAKRKGGMGGAALDIIFPFTTTPINITRQMGAYSPLGFGAAVKIARDGNLAGATDAASRALVGSTAMLLGVVGRALGWITGGEDEDKSKAAWDKATGQGIYSIGGTVSYDWAQPFGSLLALGAEMYDALEGEKGWADAVMNALYVAGDSVLNLSIFQNVTKLLKGTGSPTEKTLETIATSLVSQGIPGLAGDLAKIIDGTVRSTYTGGNVYDDIRARAMSAIPGLTENLPESVNVKGETNTRGNLLERALNVLVNPGNITKGEKNEVDLALEALYNETGSKAIFPDTSPYSFNAAAGMDVPNGKVVLTGEERETFQKTQGTTFYDMLGEVIKSDAWDMLDATGKEEIIGEIKSLALDRAKTEYYDNKGLEGYDSQWEEIGALENPADYFVAEMTLSDAKNRDETANYDVIDIMLLSLEPDAVELLSDGGLNLDNLIYAADKGIGSEAWYSAKDAIDTAEDKLGGSDIVSAFAIADNVSGDDAAKLTVLETHLMPDDGGKRNATVRRFEAAVNSGISFDEWVAFEALARDIGGSSLSRDEIERTTAQLHSQGMLKNFTSDQIYDIYKKHPTDESKVTVYDTKYGEENPVIDKDTPSYFDYVLGIG